MRCRFKGTIKENLLWGNENATAEDLEKALEISQAKEFVDTKEACTTDDANGFALLYGKVDICQRFVTAAAIRKAYMVKDNRCIFICVFFIYDTCVIFFECTVIRKSPNLSRKMNFF